MRWILPTLLLFTGCASDAQWVKGRAQVITWNRSETAATGLLSSPVRTVRFCDTNQTFQLGVFTSNAAFSAFEVDRWFEADPSPVLVDLSGFRAALPSSWQPAPGVAGVLSVGAIKPVERGTCR